MSVELLAALTEKAADVRVALDLDDVAVSGSVSDLAESDALKIMTAAERAKLAGMAEGATANATDATLLSRANHTGTQAISTVSGLQTALDGKVAASEKGAANGVAPLGSDGKIAEGYLPAVAITDTFAVASQAAMLALTAQRGDIAVRSDLNKSFVLAAEPAATLGNWVELRTPTDAVLSVAGRTGAVTLTSSDVGLGNVANKSEAQLVASGAVADALAGKAASGHAHADATTAASGFMSAADKTKLAGIAEGATANATDATLLSRANHTGTQAIATVSGLQTALDGKLASVEKGAANGVAPLGSDGKIAEGYLPAVAITDTFVVASQTAMLALTAQRGDIAVRSDLNKSFVLSAEPATTLANWIELRTPTDAVLSVAGKTGAVALTSADVGLGNVTNKSEAQLVASGAVADALAGKAAASHVHGTATSGASGFMSAGDKAKLDALAPIGAAATIITDWNAAVTNGFFAGENAANAPQAGWFIGAVVRYDDNWITQEVHLFTDGDNFDTGSYRRQKRIGAWTSWMRTFSTREELEDVIASSLTPGANITVTYNDATGKTTIGASGTISTAASAVSVAGGTGLSATDAQAALAELQAEKLDKTGGALTGNIAIAGNWPTYTADRADDSTNARVVFSTSGSARYVWSLFGAEAGGNAGGNIALSRWSDTGSYIDDVLAFERSSGYAYFGAAVYISTNYPALHWGSGSNAWRAIKDGVQGSAGNLVIQHSSDSFGANFANAVVAKPNGDVELALGAFKAFGSGPAEATQGIKWYRSVNLPSGTDCDTVLDAGRYDVETPTNGPFSGIGWIFLDVERFSQDANWALQRATQFFGGGTSAVWQRVKRGGAWSAWGPVGGWITPEHFGAVGDGVADDSAALERALRYGAPVLLWEVYRLTRTVTFGAGVGAVAVCVQGAGKRHVLNNHAGDALFFALGTPGNYQSGAAALVMRDITIAGTNDNAGAGLVVTGAGGSGSTSKSCHIVNVRVEGVDDTKGFNFGFFFSNARNFVLDGCHAQGKRTNAPGARSGAAFHVEGAGDPVDMTYVNCHAYYHASGFSSAGTIEGMAVDKAVVVGCDRGVNAQWDENPISGDNEGKPLLKVTNGHFNCRDYGVYMDRVRDYNISQNDFLAEQANSNWNGIYTDVDGGASVYGWIDGNKFQDANGLSSNTTIGINADAHTTGVTDSRIGLNRYVSLKVGLNINANVKNLRYSGASMYADVTTAVNNAGGGTNTAY